MNIRLSQFKGKTSELVSVPATYFEIGIDVFRNDVLGFGFVLTIDDVHVQLSFVAFEQRAQVADVLTALFNGLQEHANSFIITSIQLIQSVSSKKIPTP